MLSSRNSVTRNSSFSVIKENSIPWRNHEQFQIRSLVPQEKEGRCSMDQKQIGGNEILVIGPILGI